MGTFTLHPATSIQPSYLVNSSCHLAIHPSTLRPVILSCHLLLPSCFLALHPARTLSLPPRRQLLSARRLLPAADRTALPPPKLSRLAARAGSSHRVLVFSPRPLQPGRPCVFVFVFAGVCRSASLQRRRCLCAASANSASGDVTGGQTGDVIGVSRIESPAEEVWCRCGRPKTNTREATPGAGLGRPSRKVVCSEAKSSASVSGRTDGKAKLQRSWR